MTTATVAKAVSAHHVGALAHSMTEVVAVECIATAFLLIGVVGSGIMAERLCGGNVGLALLVNAIATGGALVALILAFGPRSGAHMNPAVTLAAALTGGLRWRLVPGYIVAQIAGAIVGVWLAHVMFELPVLQLSTHIRSGVGQWIAEIVATFGLLATIWGCRTHAAPVTAFAVGAYITGAYWFTASTSFANPAVTIARGLTDTFAGIRPADAPGFILAQLVAVVLALPLLRRHTHPLT
ncbi:MAG TPA: MIP/aquaporin family protein [Stellaceae bacterium]|nr:MIP/aquaporin family protein [Stellaceae bacterium]